MACGCESPCAACSCPPQTWLPTVKVEAHGEAAQRLAACAKACEGIPTAALEAGILGDLLDGLCAFYERGADINPEAEMYLLERLGRLGGAAAECCGRRK
jgi:hypothetical protein